MSGLSFFRSNKFSQWVRNDQSFLIRVTHTNLRTPLIPLRSNLDDGSTGPHLDCHHSFSGKTHRPIESLLYPIYSGIVLVSYVHRPPPNISFSSLCPSNSLVLSFLRLSTISSSGTPHSLYTHPTLHPHSTPCTGNDYFRQGAENVNEIRDFTVNPLDPNRI